MVANEVFKLFIDPPRLLLEGGSCGSFPNAKENCSTFSDLIDLDAEEICEFLYL